MTRRELLKLGMVVPLMAPSFAQDERWRTFQITTRIDLQKEGESRAWIPIPTAREPYQRVSNVTWRGAAARATRDAKVPMLAVNWLAGSKRRTFDVVATMSTRNWAVRLDPASHRLAVPADPLFLQPTALIPTDGIVRDTALKITAPHSAPLAKARAIYDWIVDNTLRDATVRGCGLGDIRWMLETKTFAGKCADLNALFVGLARSVGLPARDVYGLRVAPSAHFSSLGKSGTVTTAQHCRAEVHVQPFGWIPVDPADVAKIRLEERSNGPLDDPYLRGARERLFGSWEMNWIAYNDAHDVTLPGAKGKTLPYFMYPLAEIDGERIDSLDPEQFQYTITAEEL